MVCALYLHPVQGSFTLVSSILSFNPHNSYYYLWQMQTINQQQNSFPDLHYHSSVSPPEVPNLMGETPSESPQSDAGDRSYPQSLQPEGEQSTERNKHKLCPSWASALRCDPGGVTQLPARTDEKKLGCLGFSPCWNGPVRLSSAPLQGSFLEPRAD